MAQTEGDDAPRRGRVPTIIPRNKRSLAVKKSDMTHTGLETVSNPSEQSSKKQRTSSPGPHGSSSTNAVPSTTEPPASASTLSQNPAGNSKCLPQANHSPPSTLNSSSLVP